MVTFLVLVVVMWDRKRRDNSLGIIASSVKGLE